MASSTRIRIEPDIEDYLRSQSERVIGKPGEQATGADLTTLTNRLLYEHKLAQSMTKQVPFARLFNWLMGLVPSGGKVVAFAQQEEAPALKEAPSPDNFDFDADFAAQFEEDAA